MDSEQTVDFQKEIEYHTFFSHLVLDRFDKKLSELILGSEGFNPKELKVDLKINGVPINVEDFNAVMGDWKDRIEKAVVNKHSLFNFEEAVKAETKHKLYELIDKIDWSE